MSRIRPGIRRLLRLRGRSARDAAREVDDEIQLHIELRAAELAAAGLHPDQALAEARRLFAVSDESVGALYATARERDQQMRMRERWESWAHDVRYAARGLARDRALALFVVIVLSLGIGLNVTAFNVLDRLLLRPPSHVVQPDQLVRLYGHVPEGAGLGERTTAWIPYRVYEGVRDGARVLARVAAYRVVPEIVAIGPDARRMRVGTVTGEFFPLLGTRPQLGSFFAPGEDATTSGPRAVLSARLWREAFASSANVIGQRVKVEQEEYTVAGVAPEGFSGPEMRGVDVWLIADPRRVNTTNWIILGRRRAGVSLAVVAAESQAGLGRVRDALPRSFTWFRDARMSAAPIRYDEQGREPLEATLARWLAGVSGAILVVAIANIINLLLVRLARRRRELAVRIALGAGRSRIMRLLWIEGVLLALTAGAGSLWVAAVTEPVVRRAILANDAPWSFSIGDARVLLWAASVVIGLSLVIGIVPALRADSALQGAALRGKGMGGEPASSRLRSFLTVMQAALSVMLLVGAGLFLRSMARVRALDLGVDRDRVIVAAAQLPPLQRVTRETIAASMAQERDVYRRLVTAVRQLPGVEHAAIAVGLPLDGGSFSAAVVVPGRDSVPTISGAGPFASVVGAGYFATVGTRLLNGREFTEQDREGTEPVVIVGETMARRLWAERSPLGECVRIGPASAPCARVVGVVEDVHRVGLREQASLQYYMPLGQQNMFGGATLVVRPLRSAPISLATLRRSIAAADPAVGAVELRWLEDTLDGEMRPLRLGMVTFGLSAALALVVAVLGLYSVMSYLVAWRRHEIGIRLAIGASSRQIAQLVITNGVALVTTGVLIGIALAVIGARQVQPFLFETRAVDPLVLGGVATLLLTVAALAAWMPARRAVRIDPTEALRAD